MNTQNTLSSTYDAVLMAEVRGQEFILSGAFTTDRFDLDQVRECVQNNSSKDKYGQTVTSWDNHGVFLIAEKDYKLTHLHSADDECAVTYTFKTKALRRLLGI